jgi:hypothetical protein
MPGTATFIELLDPDGHKLLVSAGDVVSIHHERPDREVGYVYPVITLRNGRALRVNYGTYEHVVQMLTYARAVVHR